MRVAVPVNKDPTEDSAVFVFGHVNKAGKVPYRSGYRLSDYISAAGGPQPKANLGGVTITRGSKRQKISVDAHKIMYEGRQELDIILQEGDIVHVPEAFFFAANWQDIVNVLFTGVAIWSIFK